MVIISALEELKIYRERQLTNGKRIRLPKLQQLTPHGRPLQIMRKKNIFIKKEKIEAAKENVL